MLNAMAEHISFGAQGKKAFSIDDQLFVRMSKPIQGMIREPPYHGLHGMFPVCDMIYIVLNSSG